ncbi:MAG: endopeptidase La [Firmicutes bacterium]|nr:endopeptidase La [Bacillota bacterium]MCL5064669.1 endopeptidase La [Bacillota bacterium]
MTALPLLPLRGVLVFPSMVVPLEVGREKSLTALEAAMLHDRQLVFVAQRETRLDNPGPTDLYPVGIVGEVKQLLKMPSGGSKVVVEGHRRARISEIHEAEGYLQALVEEVEEDDTFDTETEALMHLTVQLFEQYVKSASRMPGEASLSMNLDDAGRLADTITSYLDVRTQDKQDILEAFSVNDRLTRVSDLLSHQIDLLEVEKRINIRVRKQMERTQKEYYLREQLKAIQKELGESEEVEDEIQEFRDRLAALTDLPEATRDKVTREIERMAKMPAMSAEAVVVRNYVDWILSLPWDVATSERLDLDEAEAILASQHYGLDRVKERILEYLAVRQMSKSLKGPILCLVGPPGVGKTSLAQSIAEATGRQFARVSLGGVRDEAEIRGHRRTYVGAMPGRIIQALRQSGSRNPLFLLDEVDKMAQDFRGDPAAALLEVLDPEQNAHFSDHFIEIPVDLSQVMFITTANVAHTIPAPLLDRMEVISLPGYTEEEKREIARKHLWPKQRDAHGLGEDQVQISDNALAAVIRGYTREAGVRQLERQLEAILRKVAREILQGRATTFPVRISKNRVDHYLGRVKVRHQAALEGALVGTVTGLAVTEAGGDVMPIEVTTMPGRGKLSLTGKLGDVMQESAQAAFSYIRAHTSELGVAEDFHEHVDVHVHVPEGAIPKDGPSAGIAIATAIISALTKIPVASEVAMTGEITLRGRVLPVGGIKEKTLAAHRAGIRMLILPEDNEPDLEDIPENIVRDLSIHWVDTLDKVLHLALNVEGMHGSS